MSPTVSPDARKKHLEQQFLFLAAGDRFEQFFDRPWQAFEPRQTHLVLIGRVLNQRQIQETLSSLVKPI